MQARYMTLMLAVLGLWGCGQERAPAQHSEQRTSANEPTPSPQPPANPPGRLPESAIARLSPTQGNQASGMLMLATTPDGVRISGAVQGLEPNGEFGFHIHEKGDCSAPDGSSAGAHFNPENKQHGHPDKPEHHAGDMVNIRSNADGVAQVDTTVKGLTLHAGQPTDVLGRSIIVHAKPDDYTTQPAGNSGARIACGVITVESQNAGGGTSGD